MSWRMPTFKFRFEETRVIHVPKAFVMENILDFDHVNYVHRRCYAYCRVIARRHAVALLEYGVRHLPGLPFVTHYTMHHEYHAPDTVVHYARAGGRGPWVKSIMRVADLQTADGPATEYHHVYERELPMWMQPFHGLLVRCIKRWTNILWEEDASIVERRFRLAQGGFQSRAACSEWVFEHGTGSYRLRA